MCLVVEVIHAPLKPLAGGPHGPESAKAAIQASQRGSHWAQCCWWCCSCAVYVVVVTYASTAAAQGSAVTFCHRSKIWWPLLCCCAGNRQGEVRPIPSLLDRQIGT